MEKKMKFMDFLALPFSMMGVGLLIFAVMVGGKWTAECMLNFLGHAEGKIKELESL